MKLSTVTQNLIDYIKAGKSNSIPVHTVNALGSGPLAYRTFGGNYQHYDKIDDAILEKAFGSHYLLTMIAQAVIVKKLLYPDGLSRHNLYCDGPIYKYFNRHGIVDGAVWDKIDHTTLERNISPKNTDYRIYYSYSKPDALLQEAAATKNTNIPVLFVDTDIILKRRHDDMLKNSDRIKAAYSHLEAIGNACYPKFSSLNLPAGYRLRPVNEALPAVNTCLMFFNDKKLMTDWASFFKELFIDNWVRAEITPALISRQLLGIDQRTFPFVCDWQGVWGTNAVVPFLDMTWNPPAFYYNRTGAPAHWHYYRLEHHPENPHWHQKIMHTWINKANVERDDKFRLYQGQIMLEIILGFRPDLEKSLRTFPSLTEYFNLFDARQTIEEQIKRGIIRSKIDKTL